MFRFVEEERALILRAEGEKVLVIPDIHIGFERELAEKGVNIPSQTGRLFEKLEGIVVEHRPDRVIFLGDVKHGTSRILRHEWMEIPVFFERLLKLIGEVEVVPGNHDGGLKALLPREVVFHSRRERVLEDEEKALVIHGHAWPSPRSFDSDLIIMGHGHFQVEFREETGVRMVEPVWLVASWNPRKIAEAYLRARKIRVRDDPLLTFGGEFGIEVAAPRIIVMPSFNPMLGGMTVNRRPLGDYISPIFRSGAVDVEDSEVHLLDGTYLGRVSDLHLSEVDYV